MKMLLAAAVLLACAAPSAAQPLAPTTVAVRQALPASIAHAGAAALTVAAPPSAGRSFAIEAAGGIAGSMLGFGSIYLIEDRCEADDLSCTLESVFTGIVLGTAASTAGAYFAGRAGDTDPSLLGAGIGAVVGAGAGIGLWHLFTEELDIGNGRVAAVLTYTVTQGVTTALGSRLLRRLR